MQDGSVSCYLLNKEKWLILLTRGVSSKVKSWNYHSAINKKQSLIAFFLTYMSLRNKNSMQKFNNSRWKEKWKLWRLSVMALIKIKPNFDLKGIFFLLFINGHSNLLCNSIIHFLIDVEATSSIFPLTHIQLKSKSNLTILGWFH